MVSPQMEYKVQVIVDELKRIDERVTALCETLKELLEIQKALLELQK